MRNISAILLLIFVTLTFVTSTVLAQHPGNLEDEGEQTGTLTFSGNNVVGATWETTITEELEGFSIISMAFQLTWIDDQGANSDPDTFSLVTNDERHEPKSDSGDGGSVATMWSEDDLNTVWNLAVTCDAAGDTEVPIGPLGLITQQKTIRVTAGHLKLHTHTPKAGADPADHPQILTHYWKIRSSGYISD